LAGSEFEADGDVPPALDRESEMRGRDELPWFVSLVDSGSELVEPTSLRTTIDI